MSRIARVWMAVAVLASTAASTVASSATDVKLRGLLD